MSTSGKFVPLPVVDRIRKRVLVSPDGCWIWQGGTNGKGYGQISVDGSLRVVHRVVAEEVLGPIPAGSYVRRRCEVKGCVNPDHLFVTEPHTVPRSKTANDRHHDTERRVIAAAERLANALQEVEEVHASRDPDQGERRYLMSMVDRACKEIDFSVRLLREEREWQP